MAQESPTHDSHINNPHIEESTVENEYVPLAEAAERLGVSVDTIRRRIRKGGLDGRKEATAAGFKWLVRLPEGGALPPPPSQTQIVPINDQAIGLFRDQLAVKDEQLRQRDQEIERLHTLLAQALERPPASDSGLDDQTTRPQASVWERIKRLFNDSSAAE